jgi:large subunit ribosomal protein L32
MTPPALSTCPHCKQPKRPHRVCPKCGYYGDEEIMVVKAT